MFFRVITYLFIVGSLLAYFFSEYYVAELAISFLPYWVLWAIIMVLFWLIVSVVSWKKIRVRRHAKFLKIEKLIFVLLWLWLFFLYWSEIKQFYYSHSYDGLAVQESGAELQVDENTISVLFANLLWTNTEYDAIENMISESNPDVLMFVEFADHHYEALHEFLLENYPFVNRTTRSKSLMVWSMVFSKYPINNSVEEFEQWPWRYGYFELLFDEEPYYFYLVHTSSPISKSFWDMRNRQLTILSDDFVVHEEFRKHNNLVMVWDFKLSPWSYYYNEFVSKFPSNITNISNRSGMIFSWYFKFFWLPLKFLQVHIDHIFTNIPDDVFLDEVLVVPGSDHKALLFYIKWL